MPLKSTWQPGESYTAADANDVANAVNSNTTAIAARVPTSRIISTGSGLTGGGDLATDRALGVDFGTGAGKVCQGDDPRLSDARPPTVHTHNASDITGLVGGDKEWSGTKSGTGTLTLTSSDMRKAWLIEGYSTVYLPAGASADWVILGATPHPTYSEYGPQLYPPSGVLHNYAVGTVTAIRIPEASRFGVLVKYIGSGWTYSGAAVSGSDIGVGSVVEGHLVTGAVTTGKIADYAVTASKLAPVLSRTVESIATYPSPGAAIASGNHQMNVTALATNATFVAPTGTLYDGGTLLYRVKDNGTARTLSYNAVFRPIGVTLPTTTTPNKTLYIGARWNAADSKWDVLAVGAES